MVPLNYERHYNIILSFGRICMRCSSRPKHLLHERNGGSWGRPCCTPKAAVAAGGHRLRGAIKKLLTVSPVQ